MEVGSVSLRWNEVSGRMGWYAEGGGSASLSASYDSCTDNLSLSGKAEASLEFGLVVSVEVAKALGVGSKGGLEYAIEAVPKYNKSNKSIDIDLTGEFSLKAQVWFNLNITSFFSLNFSKSLNASDRHFLTTYSVNVG